MAINKQGWWVKDLQASQSQPCTEMMCTVVTFIPTTWIEHYQNNVVHSTFSDDVKSSAKFMVLMNDGAGIGL